MATLYIEEHIDVARGSAGGLLHGVIGFPLKAQKVAIGAMSAQSQATSDAARFVLLTADTACQYAIGPAPTADANGRYLPANTPLAVAIDGGDKIAVIEPQ